MSIVIVDPVSTGGALAAEYYERGYQLICVWSNEVGDIKSHVPDCAKAIKWLATVDQMEEPETSVLAAKINSLIETELVACVVGAETGVVTADALSAELGLRSNGVNEKRRNKSWQQKTVASAGLRATREASGTALSDVETFLETETYPIIVKPTESAGSDGVKKCHSREEAEAHFKLLMKAQRRIGSAIKGAAVICQEFLAGDEYVVDHVSRDGVHKTCMIWRYDRAATNGGDFVLFNMIPVPADAPVAAELIEYTRGILDALGLRHGPSHGEIMMTRDGPCMVEMNCRAHGADGTWARLARELTGGYSQVDAAVDAMLDDKAFAAIPNVYCNGRSFRAAGQLVQLVSKFEGTISSVAPLAAIRELRSYQYMQVAEAVAPGKALVPTIDLFTGMGFVIVCHAEQAVVAEDVATIRALEDEGRLVELLELSSDDEAQEVGEQPSPDAPTTPRMSPLDYAAQIELAERVSEQLWRLSARSSQCVTPEASWTSLHELSATEVMAL